MRWIVVLFLIGILFSLGSGLAFLLRDKEGSTRMVKALTWRIGLSLLLFVLLIISYFLGWAHPQGIVS